MKTPIVSRYLLRAPYVCLVWYEQSCTECSVLLPMSSAPTASCQPTGARSKPHLRQDTDELDKGSSGLQGFPGLAGEQRSPQRSWAQHAVSSSLPASSTWLKATPTRRKWWSNQWSGVLKQSTWVSPFATEFVLEIWLRPMFMQASCHRVRAQRTNPHERGKRHVFSDSLSVSEPVHISGLL